MIQKDKELLLKDLCARLSFGVICDRLGQPKKLLSISPYKVYCLEFDNGEYMPGEYKVEDIKPYLRQMSSMTEDEKKEFYEVSGLNCYDGLFTCKKLAKRQSFIGEVLDWLNAHHFDYRCLIERGLALEAPEGMYKIE